MLDQVFIWVRVSLPLRRAPRVANHSRLGSLLYLFYLHQMRYFIDHPTDARGVTVGYRMMQATQSQGLNRFPLILGSADTTLDPGNFELGHKYTYWGSG